jgi:Ca-activated chloride channel family protein
MLEAIDGITVRHRTAIGDGLIEAVAALPGRTRPPEGQEPPASPMTPQTPGVVVLLSDGQNNSGMDPIDAAEWARRQHVKVYTVGIGSRLGSTTGFMIGGPLDENTLRAIAERTGGTYNYAASTRQLRGIYRTLGRSIGWATRPVEVTLFLAPIVAALLLCAIALSVQAQPLLT